MSEALRKLSSIEYGASPKEIRANDFTPIGIYGTGGFVGYSEKALFRGPLIVIARKGTLDKPIFVERECWVIDTAFAVLPQNGVDGKWLYYQLANFDLKKLNESTGVPSISRDYLYRVCFEKPSFPEQRKIARILSTVDAVIEKTEAAIAKYEEIKQGMMIDLFTRGIDPATGKLRPRYEDAPELYKETELGRVPKEWEVEFLEKITDRIGDGIHTTPVYVDESEYFFINGNNLSNGHIVFDGKTKCVDQEEYKKHYLELGPQAILLSINGTIGNMAYYDGEKVILGKSAAYICCKAKIHRAFIYYLLNSSAIKSYFEIELTGSTINNLSLKSIRLAPVLLPKNPEQLAIAQRLTIIDKQIETEIGYLEKIKNLKQGLMADLLTGRVRVQVAEEPAAEMAEVANG